MGPRRQGCAWPNGRDAVPPCALRAGWGTRRRGATERSTGILPAWQCEDHLQAIAGELRAIPTSPHEQAIDRGQKCSPLSWALRAGRSPFTHLPMIKPPPRSRGTCPAVALAKEGPCREGSRRDGTAAPRVCVAERQGCRSSLRASRGIAAQCMQNQVTPSPMTLMLAVAPCAPNRPGGGARGIRARPWRRLPVGGRGASASRRPPPIAERAPSSAH